MPLKLLDLHNQQCYQDHLHFWHKHYKLSPQNQHLQVDLPPILASLTAFARYLPLLAACEVPAPKELPTIVLAMLTPRSKEMKPSIDVAMNLAKQVDTTVGYLLGETKEVLKDPDMLKRLNDIIALPDADKSYILYTIDNLLASVKTRLAYK